MIKFKAIVPKKNKIVNSIIFANRIKTELRAASKDLISEYEKTVSTWSRKPDFKAQIGYNFFGGWSLNVYPTGKHKMQYIWVDLGTLEHEITPVRAPALVFKRGYKPRTHPRVIGSGSYKRFGPTWRVQRVVQSVTPRLFSETIQEHYQPTFVTRMNYAFKQTAKSLEE